MSVEPQPLSPEIEPPPPTLAERVRQVLAIPARLLGALFLPDRLMPRIVAREKSGAAVLVVLLSCGLAAFAVGARVNVAPQVLAKIDAELKMAGADAQQKSDREVADDVSNATKVAQVMLGLNAGLFMPLAFLAESIVLLLLGRFVGGTPKFARVVTAVAYAWLPFAVRWLIVAGVAWSSSTLVPGELDNLTLTIGAAHVPVLIFFVLWHLVVLGFGLAAAASISRLRAFTAIGATFMILTLFAVGLAGGGQGPAPTPPGGAQ
jgi:Yip1-like protein